MGLISNSFSTNELKNISYADIKLPPGRSELLQLDKGDVFIDFAHDPDAMENILSSLSELSDADDNSSMVVAVIEIKLNGH